MDERLTYLIELAVGVASLGVGVAAGRSGRWVLATVFAVAGVAATIHAAIELAP